MFLEEIEVGVLPPNFIFNALTRCRHLVGDKASCKDTTLRNKPILSRDLYPLLVERCSLIIDTPSLKILLFHPCLPYPLDLFHDLSGYSTGTARLFVFFGHLLFNFLLLMICLLLTLYR